MIATRLTNCEQKDKTREIRSIVGLYSNSNDTTFGIAPTRWRVRKDDGSLSTNAEQGRSKVFAWQKAVRDYVHLGDC